MLQTIKTVCCYAALGCIIVSGLFLNIVQLFVFILVRPLSQSLYREINHYIQYGYWSQTVAIADWGSNLKCRLYFKDDQSYKEFGTRSGIVIANHRYDIDWLAAWMLSEKLGTLGSDKSLLKAQLRYIPVIGWGWSLSDMVFLYRNWQKDHENISKSMDILLTYPRSFILAFFEGTRFTKSKYEVSVKYAEENNLPIRLKHHLNPRTRGFNCMMQRVKHGLKQNEKLQYGLYNMQVALDNDDNRKASLSSVLGGVPTTVHIYVERLDVNDVSVENDNETSLYLYQVYKKKDDLVEYFAKHGKFPGIEKPYKPRPQSLINWIFWMLLVYSSLIYLYYECFASGNLLSYKFGSLLLMTLLVLVSIMKLVNSTKVSKSSAYGT